jgi:hypothetical protein
VMPLPLKRGALLSGRSMPAAGHASPTPRGPVPTASPCATASLGATPADTHAPGVRGAPLQRAERSSPNFSVISTSGRGASPGSAVPPDQGRRHEGLGQPSRLPQGPPVALLALTPLRLAPALPAPHAHGTDELHHMGFLPQLGQHLGAPPFLLPGALREGGGADLGVVCLLTIGVFISVRCATGDRLPLSFPRFPRYLGITEEAARLSPLCRLPRPAQAQYYFGGYR